MHLRTRAIGEPNRRSLSSEHGATRATVVAGFAGLWVFIAFSIGVGR
jgi:hypothetical protein